MEGKAKYIFPAFLSGIMAFLMTAVITWLNLGFVPNFIALWLRAWVIAWPLAYCAALIAAPFAKRATAFVLTKLDGAKG